MGLPVIRGVVAGQVVQDEDMAPLSAGLTGAVEEFLKVFVEIILIEIQDVTCSFTKVALSSCSLARETAAVFLT